MAVDLKHPDRDLPVEMTGPEMKAIRDRLGLSATELGRAFGYAGSDVSVKMAIHRFESTGKTAREIPPWLARLLVMFDRHGVPEEFLEVKTPIGDTK